MNRPTEQANYKSWTVNWKGNTPVLTQTAWAPDYTPAHKETPQEAIAAEAIALMDSIAAFREKWLKLNLLAEQQNHQLQADAFGSLLSTEQMRVTETDDPNETMTMPPGAVDVPTDPTDQDIEDLVEAEFEAYDPIVVHQASVEIPLAEGADLVEKMYADLDPVDGDVPASFNDPLYKASYDGNQSGA